MDPEELNDLDKEEQSWRLTPLQQSYNNQERVPLA